MWRLTKKFKQKFRMEGVGELNESEKGRLGKKVSDSE